MTSELTHRIVDSYRDRPNAALLVSLGGSNARNLLADDEIRDLYNITTIVTDRPTSGAAELANDYNLMYLPHFTTGFPTRKERYQYFDNLAIDLGRRGVGICLYAGFMKIAAGPLVDEFPGVNTHPADLTQTDSRGVPKFRGMDAIDLMRAGTDGTIGASVHTVDHSVDTGDTFVRSLPFAVEGELTQRECHELIKPIEHVIYPTALKLLGRGVLELDDMPYTYDPATGQVSNNQGEKVDGTN